MKSLLSRAASRTALFLASLAPLAAHPGHDDGHELTWDLEHLANHPRATLLCAAVLALGAWSVVALYRRSQAVPVQSLRGSHASRGK